MTRFKLMSRFTALAVAAVLAIASLAGSALAQDPPPHRFYGTGATAGDEITALVSHGDHYDEVGSATVDANGSWYIDVPAAMADEVVWEVNGEHADAAITPDGETQSSVVLTIHMEDDSMMEEGDEDSMMEEGEEDSMMEEGDDDAMLDEEGESLYPDTGTGGLADTSGGVSAGLIGLLIAIGAVAVTGLSLRRVRNRA